MEEERKKEDVPLDGSKKSLHGVIPGSKSQGFNPLIEKGDVLHSSGVVTHEPTRKPAFPVHGSSGTSSSN